jgi:polyhydroxybutyrate depolymerase
MDSTRLVALMTALWAATVGACATDPAPTAPADAALVEVLAADASDAGVASPEDAATAAAADAAARSQDAGAARPDAAVSGSPDAGASASACGDRVVPGCTTTRDGFECTLMHGGLARTFRLHVPANYAQRPASGAPLVFAFHGLRTTAAIMAYVSELHDTAEREGFVLVYPEGIDMSFNAGRCCGTASADEVDDVGFTLAIIEQLTGALCIDRRRVYATGLSNGGHMAYRLACERADVFAAVTSIAGVVAMAPCRPSRPIPILHFHGTEDSVVGYDLGIDGRGAERTVDDWATRNGCGDQSRVVSQVGEVTCRARSGCADGSAAELCTIEGGGHQWPGGRDLPLLGHNTRDISASAASWAFFARFTRP